MCKLILTAFYQVNFSRKSLSDYRPGVKVIIPLTVSSIEAMETILPGQSVKSPPPVLVINATDSALFKEGGNSS